MSQSKSISDKLRDIKDIISGKKPLVKRTYIVDIDGDRATVNGKEMSLKDYQILKETFHPEELVFETSLDRGCEPLISGSLQPPSWADPTTWAKELVNKNPKDNWFSGEPMPQSDPKPKQQPKNFAKKVRNKFNAIVNPNRFARVDPDPPPEPSEKEKILSGFGISIGEWEGQKWISGQEPELNEMRSYLETYFNHRNQDQPISYPIRYR